MLSDCEGILTNSLSQDKPASELAPSNQTNMHHTTQPTQNDLPTEITTSLDISNATAYTVNTDNPTSAKTDLTTERSTSLATPTDIILTCTRTDFKLTSLNPQKLATSLDILCGAPNLIDKVEYLPTGSLLIKTQNSPTAQKLHAATSIPIPGQSVPVKSVYSWQHQFSYGKLYAPEFTNWPVAEILQVLEPHKVVGVRKLFSDPMKSAVPLYVITFLGPRPTSIKIGYTKYTIDQHIPNPMRCGNCCRWGHTTTKCRSSVTCGRCSGKGHKHTECTATTICCPNCKGDHEVNSKTCTNYLLELEACRLQAANNISFPEARRRAREPKPTSCSQTQRTPLLPTNDAHFPPLPSKTTSAFLEHASPLPQTPHYAQVARTQPRPQNPRSSFSQQLNKAQIQHSQSSTEPQNPTASSSNSPRTHSQFSQLPSSHNSHLNNPIIEDTQLSQRSSATFDELPCNQEQFQQADRAAYPDLSMPASQSTSGTPQFSLTSRHTQDPGNENSFLTTLLKALPYLLKLLFATSHTDKIAALVNIGHMLNISQELNQVISTIELPTPSSQPPFQ